MKMIVYNGPLKTEEILMPPNYYAPGAYGTQIQDM